MHGRSGIDGIPLFLSLSVSPMALGIRTPLHRLTADFTLSPPMRLAHPSLESSPENTHLSDNTKLAGRRNRAVGEPVATSPSSADLPWHPRANPLMHHAETPKTARADGPLHGEGFRELRGRNHASPQHSRNGSPLACRAIPTESLASRHPHPRASTTRIPLQIDGMRLASFVAPGAPARS